MDSEAIIRDLVATFPDAYDADDPFEEFLYEDGDGVHWLVYVAMPYARDATEEHALVVDRPAQTVRVVDEERLRRWFAFVERYADGADRDMRNLLMIECFEGTPWVEDVIEFCGPHTVALLREAQVVLANANGWIGRWRVPPPA